MAKALASDFLMGSCWHIVSCQAHRSPHGLEPTSCFAKIHLGHHEKHRTHPELKLFQLAPSLKKAARLLPSSGRQHSKSISVTCAAAVASDTNGAAKRGRKKKDKSAANDQTAPQSIRRSGKLAAAEEQSEGVSQKVEGGVLGTQASNPAETPEKKPREPSSNGVAKAKRPSPLITVSDSAGLACLRFEQVSRMSWLCRRELEASEGTSRH